MQYRQATNSTCMQSIPWLTADCRIHNNSVPLGSMGKRHCCKNYKFWLLIQRNFYGRSCILKDLFSGDVNLSVVFMYHFAQHLWSQFPFLFLLYSVSPFDLAFILLTSGVILRQLVSHGEHNKIKNSKQNLRRQEVHYLRDISFYINKLCNLDSWNVRIQALTPIWRCYFMQKRNMFKWVILLTSELTYKCISYLSIFLYFQSVFTTVNLYSLRQISKFLKCLTMKSCTISVKLSHSNSLAFILQISSVQNPRVK